MTEAMIDGQRVALRTWNRGATRPVLAVHCSLAHAGAWAPLAEALHGITLTAPDLPGHGRSADWDGVQGYHDLATAMTLGLAEAMAERGPIDLFGHSFGGTVALRIALERPELVRSLVLVEPALFAAARGTAAGREIDQHHAETFDLLAKGDAMAAAASFQAQWGAGEVFADLPPRQQDYIVKRLPTVMASDAALSGDSAGLLRPGRLESLNIPVLLVQGTESPAVVGGILDTLGARLPHTRRVMIAGARHMVPITHAALLAPEVQAHLDAS